MASFSRSARQRSVRRPSVHSGRARRTLRMQVLDDRRVLAAITGAVFDDVNDSMRRDAVEVGLVQRVVYVDQNDNEALDVGERYGLTDADGNFSIDGFVDGDYLVRVFNGTQSQTQTSPTSAVHNHDVVGQANISAALPAVIHNAGQPDERISPAVIAVGNSLQSIAADGTVGFPLDIGSNILSVDRIDGGRLLVTSDTETGHRVFEVNETVDSATPMLDSDLGPKLLSAGVDDVGTGVVIAEGVGADADVWMLDSNGLTATAVDTPTHSVVTNDTTSRIADGPTRSLISYTTQTDDGSGGMIDALAIHVWSNASASMISAAPIFVGGGLEVVAFSDEAGLVIVRGADDLTVHDLDNDLATLYTIADTAGSVDIDADRGLIVTTSPRSFAAADAGLRLIDQETGSLVADLAIDFSMLGDIATVALDAKLESVVVAGTAGLAQVNLRRAAAHRITIAGGVASGTAAFGMRMIGDNAAPAFDSAPTLTTLEDIALLRPAPGILGDAADGDNDQFVVIPIGGASVGAIEVGVDGGVTFAPPSDFAGESEITVILTDGRDAVEAILTVEVIGVADGPTGIEPIAPVPENIPLDGVMGVIDIIDADLVNDHVIEIDDPRFEVVNGELIFVGPGKLDFETEWSIPLIFTVTDADAGTSDEYATSIEIENADDPITDITPDTANVLENKPGDIIKSLAVIDEDPDQFYTFTVDDDRFEVDFGELKLVSGVALDREAEETIVVNVTATHQDDSFTKAITLTVLDAPETPENFVLSNASVLELKEAAEVGELTIAGNPAANGHSLTTNDSRFVLDGSTLRLADGVFVERTSGVDTEIQIEVTATPTLGGSGATETFVIVVIENGLPFHNSDYPEDVNGDGDATARDALIIINFLNEFGPTAVGPGDPGLGYDVNGDGEVTALDALLVINELNANGGGTGTVNNEPSGEPIADDGPIADGNSTPDSEAIAPSSQRRVAVNADSSNASIELLRTEPLNLRLANKVVGTRTIQTLAADLVEIDADEPGMDIDDLTDLVFGDDSIDLLS